MMKIAIKNNIFGQIALASILFLLIFNITNTQTQAQETEIEAAARIVETRGLVPCHPTFKPGLEDLLDSSGKVVLDKEGKPVKVNVLDNDCTYEKLIDAINTGIKYFIYLSTFIATGMFAYAGFLYFAAAANPSKKESAKKIFESVLWGLLFIYGAWLIVYTIMNSLLKDPTDIKVNPLQQAPSAYNIDNKNV